MFCKSRSISPALALAHCTTTSFAKFRSASGSRLIAYNQPIPLMLIPLSLLSASVPGELAVTATKRRRTAFRRR
jgi:hypothetical protein